jgi:hypothetical protein
MQATDLSSVLRCTSNVVEVTLSSAKKYRRQLATNHRDRVVPRGAR